MVVKLTVVIPAFNEGGYLGHTARETAAALAPAFGDQLELILVDDGSRDDTREVALDAARAIPGCSVVSYPANVGKGYAMRCGFERARGAIVAFLDADGEIRPEEVVRLVEALDAEGADVVVGRKVMAGPRPWHRRIMRWGVRWIGRTAFGLAITDPQTGIKVVRRERVGTVLGRCREQGYLFDLELLAAARRSGARLSEVDVNVRTVRPNRIPTSATWRHLSAVSALWWRSRRSRPLRHEDGAHALEPHAGMGPAREVDPVPRVAGGRLVSHPARVYALLSSTEEPGP